MMHDDARELGTGLAREHFFVSLPGGDRLSVRRFAGDPGGMPVLMLHGAIENGRIFHSRSGKGLAPWLAAEGFDVYVADFRGHGESLPRIGPHSAYGQTEAVIEDIPALVEAVADRRGRMAQGCVAHSWGGVLMNAFLARFPRYIELMGAAVYFGSKRSVRAVTPESLLKVHLIWNSLCPAVSAAVGYLPARKMGIGSDNESRRYLAQCVRWVKEDRWIDPGDGFDYDAALAALELPPTWYLAAKADQALGHPKDVRAFMEESGGGPSRYAVLGKESGNLHDYDHITMLTHPDAPRDHFPAVAEWLRSGGKTEGPGAAEPIAGPVKGRGKHGS